MKHVLFVFVLFFISLSLFSQQTPTVSVKLKGQVADSTERKSLPYATVTITKLPENKVEAKLATAQDGSFTVTIKKKGDFLITVNTMGFKAYSQKINVDFSKPNMDLGKIYLAESSVQLKDVQIIADKPLVNVEPDKLTYSAESDPDAKTTTTIDLLRKVPMVSVDGDDNVQVKGSSSFKIFINGKPSTMATSNPKDFLRGFPASSIKDIEVITSPGAKYDAEGIGGILNIITTKKSINGYNGNVGFNTATNGWYGLNGNIAVSLGKLVFSCNFSGGMYDQPSSTSESHRSNYAASDYQFSNSSSSYKSQGRHGWSDFELSYEFDTLNLLSANVSFWGSYNKSKSTGDNEIRSSLQEITSAYGNYSNNKNSYLAPSGNIDYQRTAKRNKDETFTFSYKFDVSPQSSDLENEIRNVKNYMNNYQKVKNDKNSQEHTLQADYVMPINKIHHLELGAKYILRLNTSDYRLDTLDFASQIFRFDAERSNEFSYTQNIAAAYFNYKFKLKSFGFKAGLRVENGSTDADFKTGNYVDFTNTSLEWVPSASISYQIKMKHNFQFAYTKRIQRPDIWYLNPYVNDQDPLYISYGNPNLDAERYHRLSMSYSTFGKFGSFNMSLEHSFSNNEIDRKIHMKEKVTYTTYGNISEKKAYDANMGLNLMLSKKLSFNLNSSLSYSMYESKYDINQSTEGFSFNARCGGSYRAEKDWRFNTFVGVFKWQDGMTYKSDWNYFYNVSIGKDFFKKKLSVSLNSGFFLTKYRYWKNTQTTAFYTQRSENQNVGRNVGIRISYRFGEMETSVKKAKRGINNDDKKSGGESSGGGGN
jgi:hypothetical protein